MQDFIIAHALGSKKPTLKFTNFEKRNLNKQSRLVCKVWLYDGETWIYAGNIAVKPRATRAQIYDHAFDCLLTV